MQTDWVTAGSNDHLDEYLDRVLIGGREERIIEIVDYDPQWPARYSVEREKISRALGAVARRIEHVGSTAVPGLAAKPVVDILVTVDDPDEESGFREQLEGVGYVLRVREPRHRMFRTPERDIHLHIWQARSEDESRHLRFRDRLRSSRRDREQYEQTKRSLAGRYRDGNYYAEAKTAVIEEILGRTTGAEFRPKGSGERPT